MADGSAPEKTVPPAPDVPKDAPPAAPADAPLTDEQKAKAFEEKSAEIRTKLDEASQLHSSVDSKGTATAEELVSLMKKSKEMSAWIKDIGALREVVTTWEDTDAINAFLNEYEALHASMNETIKREQARMEATAQNHAETNLNRGINARTGDPETPATSDKKESTVEKKGMDRAIDMLGNAVEKGAVIVEKVWDKLGTVFKGLSEGAKKAIYELAKMMDWKWLSNYLEPGVVTSEIRNAMKEKLGEDKVTEGKTDVAAMKKLKTQYHEKIRASEGKLVEETYAFEEYYNERIDLLAGDQKGKESFTVSDLADYKTANEQKDEAEKNDAQLEMLKKAGAKEKDGVWTIEGLTLGKSPGGTDITTVEFRKATTGGWEWRNNSEPAGKWLTKETDRFPVTGVDDGVKKAREDMNKLANDLGIKEKPEPATPTTPGTPVDTSKPAENTENTPEGRKKRFAKALIDAFNKEAKMDVITYDANNEEWTSLASRLILSLRNNEFKDYLHLSLEPDDLQATDTSYWLFANKDIIDGWAKMLVDDPERAMGEFMKLDPQKLGLNSESKRSITNIQKTLKEVKLD